MNIQDLLAVMPFVADPSTLTAAAERSQQATGTALKDVLTGRDEGIRLVKMNGHTNNQQCDHVTNALKFNAHFLQWIMYMPYISRGFIFVNFASRGAICELNNTQKIYLRSRHMNATPGMRLVYAMLVVQHTVQMSEWYWFEWFLSPLLSSSFANLTTRENVLKSWFAKNWTHEIYGVYWQPYTLLAVCIDLFFSSSTFIVGVCIYELCNTCMCVQNITKNWNIDAFLQQMNLVARHLC